MRDWSEIDLTPMFKGGMVDKRHDRLAQLNMDDVVGHRVTEFGLQALDVASLISTDGDLSSISFPLPNVFLGEKNSTIFEFEKIFSLNPSNGAATEISPAVITGYTPIPDTPINRTGPESPDVYHYADLGEGWFATDGYVMIFKSSGQVCYTFQRTANTLCKFRGRVYLGGLAGHVTHSNSAFWPSSYTDDLDALLDPDIEDVSASGLGQNVVYYTLIEALDLLLHYLQEPSKEALRHITKRGESGFVGMPWGGEVRVVKPLGDGVMVYGSNGVTFMKQEISPKGMRLVVTDHEGIPSRRCVAGDRSIHYFLGNDGGLWQVTGSSSGLQFKPLEYHNTIASMGDLDTLLLNYDSTYGDLYIGSATHSRLVTPFGMSRVNESWTSMVRSLGARTGFFVDLELDPAASFTTGIIRFPQGKYGTTHGFRLITRNPSAHTLTFRHRKNEEDGWKEITGLTLDKSGFCDVLATSYEVEITGITDVSSENTTIEGGTLFYDNTTRGLKEVAA